MSSHAERVQKLIEYLPRENDESSISVFNATLAAYRKILDELSDSSEDSIENLWGYYSKLRTAESSMSTLYQLKKPKQKDGAFNAIRREIKNDLDDLLEMVRR